MAIAPPLPAEIAYIIVRLPTKRGVSCGNLPTTAIGAMAIADMNTKQPLTRIPPLNSTGIVLPVTGPMAAIPDPFPTVRMMIIAARALYEQSLQTSQPAHPKPLCAQSIMATLPGGSLMSIKPPVTQICPSGLPGHCVVLPYPGWTPGSGETALQLYAQARQIITIAEQPFLTEAR